MEELPPFEYQAQPLGAELIASISNVLDDARIPCVLWGGYLMIVQGILLVCPGALEFCIPDEDIERSYGILEQRGFLSCLEGQNCMNATDSTQKHAYPPAARHLHLAGPTPLLLHKTSETLWTVPTFEPSSIEANPAAKIILASDQNGLPASKTFSESLHPVRVPSAHCLIEAYALLALRDDDKVPYMFTWVPLLADMSLSVKRTGHLKDQYMDPRCRDFFKAVFSPGPSVRERIDRFAESMKQDP